MVRVGLFFFMKFIKCFALSVLLLNSYASGMVVLKGRIQGFNNVKYVKLISTIKSAVSMSFETINNIPVSKDSTFSFNLNIDKAKTLFIECAGSAHEVLVSPNDTVFVDFFRRKTADTLISASTTTISREGLLFNGNNKYQYNFFDSLEKKSGILWDAPANMPSDAEGQKNTIDSVFRERVGFLESYSKKYHFSNEIKNLAYNELKGSYFNSLLLTVFSFDKNTLPDDYFSIIKKEHFTWDECSQSREYMASARNYCTYYLRKIAFGSATDEDNLNDQFGIINSTFNDEKLKDYFLTFLMNDYLERHPKNFDKIYKQYMVTCQNLLYKNAITTEYIKNQKLTDNILPDSILDGTRIIRLSDKAEITLRRMIEDQKDK